MAPNAIEKMLVRWKKKVLIYIYSTLNCFITFLDDICILNSCQQTTKSNVTILFIHYIGNGRIVQAHCIVGYFFHVVFFLLYILINVVGHWNMLCIQNIGILCTVYILHTVRKSSMLFRNSLCLLTIKFKSYKVNKITVGGVREFEKLAWKKLRLYPMIVSNCKTFHHTVQRNAIK